MPTLLSARSRARRVGGGGDSGDEDGGAVGSRVCYGLAASAVTLLLFCALAASVSVWMALAFAGLAMAALVLAACVKPQSWLVGTSGGGGGGGDDSVSDERVAAAAGRAAQRRLGMPEAAINALPTFAYELKGDGAGEVDLESGAVAGEPCSVCLEDLQAGEMVRQLPACSHLFHVGCIDMWLHTHRTCPLCRCNLLPPPRVPGKAAAAPAPAAEAEPPAGDALPPV